jgi:hypothetical protein
LCKLSARPIIRALKALASICVIAAVLAAAGAQGGAGGVPPSFHLVFDGKHNIDLLHEGPFTTASALCPSGFATDTQIEERTLTAVRRFTCSNSDADFTARVSPLPAEHGGNGTWQIVGGTGPLADFRGKGTFTSARTGGSPDDRASITFESTWDGVADLDADPPAIVVSRATARKLHRPKVGYELRIDLSLPDASGRVSYTLLVVDPRKAGDPLRSKTGLTSTGTARAVLRIRPTKRTRAIRLQVDTSDPFGNESQLVKNVRLPLT